MATLVAVGAAPVGPAASRLHPHVDPPRAARPNQGAEPCATRNIAHVNGLDLAYEEPGTGEPLILLPGGLGSGRMFAPILPALAAERRVILVHPQAHGGTADIDRHVHPTLLADDVAALVEPSLSPPQTSWGTPSAARRRFASRSSAPSWSPPGSGLCPLPSQRLVPRGTGVHARRERGRGGADAAGASLRRLRGSAAASGGLAHAGRQNRRLRSAGVRPNRRGRGADHTHTARLRRADSIAPAHIADFFAPLGGGLRDADRGGSNRPVSRLAVLPDSTYYDIVASPLLQAVALVFLSAKD